MSPRGGDTSARNAEAARSALARIRDSCAGVCALFCIAVPAASARNAVVTDRDSDAITIFDSGSGSLIKPLLATGAGKGTLPFGLAITPDGATAYVNAQEGPKKPKADR